jgi:hypothetical protein
MVPHAPLQALGVHPVGRCIVEEQLPELSVNTPRGLQA